MTRTRTDSRRGSRTGRSSPSPSDVEMARLARALGHPARAAILRHLLGRGDCVCGRLVDLLPLAQSTVSQHLKALKLAGLVSGELDGPRVCYCANRAALRRLHELIGAL